jgi:4-alpha-glucanotransferase
LSTRSICESKPSRSSGSCPSAAASGDCADSLGLLTRPVDQELAAAGAERAAWLAELRRVGLLSEHADVDEIVLALHQYLGRTPSRLLGLALPTPSVTSERKTSPAPSTSTQTGESQ